MKIMNAFINIEYKECRNSDKIFKMECETLLLIWTTFLIISIQNVTTFM